VNCITLGERGKKFYFPVLKVPRQCTFVLLVEVMHMIGIIMTLEWLHYSVNFDVTLGELN
jgi:hypothetical protein